MLNNVPSGINTLARNVVVNHPNTFNCELYRKTVKRTAPGPMVGELPTMGQLGVLDSADEEDFEYALLGNGYALPAEGFSPSPMTKTYDANIGFADEFRFLIEPEAQSGHQHWFRPKSHDIVYLLLGDGPTPPKLAFEVVGEETTSNIPPYTTRYICNRRDDMSLLSPDDYVGP